jgi:hypothetical protein
MSYMVVLTIDDLEQCPTVLDAWEELGVLGVTILSSTGLGHIRQSGLRDDIPMIPSLHDFFIKEEEQHRTLFSVVETQEMVDKMVAKAQQIIGDLDDPHTGFMFVLPVSQAYGFGKHRTDRSKE